MKRGADGPEGPRAGSPSKKGRRCGRAPGAASGHHDHTCRRQRRFSPPCRQSSRHPPLALRHRRHGDGAGHRGRRHAPDGIGSLHHRVEADPRRRAAFVRRRMAGGVRPLPPDPAIPADQQGHGPLGLQDDLLVGVVAPVPRALGRRRLRPAAPVLLAVGTDRALAEAATRRSSGARRPSGRDRLVDGRLGPRRADRRQPVPAGRAPHDRLHHPDRDALDRERVWSTVRRSARRRTVPIWSAC